MLKPMKSLQVSPSLNLTSESKFIAFLEGVEKIPSDMGGCPNWKPLLEWLVLGPVEQ